MIGHRGVHDADTTDVEDEHASLGLRDLAERRVHDVPGALRVDNAYDRQEEQALPDLRDGCGHLHQ